MAPVVKALEAEKNIESLVCVTAQHRDMLDQVLTLFSIQPEYDLDIMAKNQGLMHITTAALEGLEAVLQECQPDRVLVHGDTTTSFAASLAAFYQKIPVGHVEAGLRTGDIYAPWPEEMNRRLTDTICDMHFAPTQSAEQNLLDCGIPKAGISVTGNTVIDALLQISGRLENDDAVLKQATQNLPPLDKNKKLVLVTGHRRENFGNGFERICNALAQLAAREDVQIIYPVHLNPNVQEPVTRLLSDHANIHLIAPLDYLPFVYLMKEAHFIITDSGGVQEEASIMRVPCVTLRNNTERPETVHAGVNVLCGSSPTKLLAGVKKMLNVKLKWKPLYGDGRTGERIIK